MNITQIDWNRLRIFLYSYRKKSFLLAAKELHLTRAAVSVQIKKLEEELKEPLFLRRHRSIEPTRQAVRLAGMVSEFEKNLDNLNKDILYSKKIPRGTIRIGAPEIFGARYVIPTLARFRKKYPRVDFDIKLLLAHPMLDALEREELDFAIMDLALDFASGLPVEASELASEVQQLVCSRRYFESKFHSRTVDFQSLIESEFVTYVPTGAAVKLWFKYCVGRIPTHLRISASVQSMEGIIGAVKGDMGIGLIPTYLIKNELNSGSLRALSVGKKIYRNKMCLLKPLGQKQDMAQRLLESDLKSKLSINL